LRDLASSESCLADYFTRKKAEVSAARGDPKKLFGRPRFTPLPNADAVDLCVAQIHSTNSCLDFAAVDRVFEIDRDREECASDRRSRNGGAGSVHGLQPDRIEVLIAWGS
jgi:hypothetical protein